MRRRTIRTSCLRKQWRQSAGVVELSVASRTAVYAVSSESDVGRDVCRVLSVEYARLQLQNAPDNHYGLIVLDAFNSDAIPIHLMTEEAINLYLSKLGVGGMVAFHVSNRSLRLDTVLADLAKRNNSMSLRAVDGEHDPKTGKDPSEWVVMARHSPAFDSLSQIGAGDCLKDEHGRMRGRMISQTS